MRSHLEPLSKPDPKRARLLDKRQKERPAPARDNGDVGRDDPGSRQPGPRWASRPTTNQMAWTGTSPLLNRRWGTVESNAIESPGFNS